MKWKQFAMPPNGLRIHRHRIRRIEQSEADSAQRSRRHKDHKERIHSEHSFLLCDVRGFAVFPLSISSFQNRKRRKSWPKNRGGFYLRPVFPHAPINASEVERVF